jgi:hypothetical protein
VPLRLFKYICKCRIFALFKTFLLRKLTNVSDRVRDL